MFDILDKSTIFVQYFKCYESDKIYFITSSF